jgi:hypothetical protein
MSNFSGAGDAMTTGTKELGRAKYRAQQVPGAVVIFAEGWHPTGGYRDFFEQSPLDIYPPQFILWQVPPAGVATQQITPFVIWVMFGASETVETVTVSDADGNHDVKVKQTPDVVVTKSQRTWIYGDVVARLNAEAEGGAEIAVSGERSLSAAANELTTLRVGEEGASFTTLRLGEEEPPLTTLRLGEEEPQLTTLRLGEEDPPITTLRVGEEGQHTTLRVGEEGPTTLMLGEEESNVGGPEGGNPFGGF